MFVIIFISWLTPLPPTAPVGVWEKLHCSLFAKGGGKWEVGKRGGEGGQTKRHHFVAPCVHFTLLTLHKTFVTLQLPSTAQSLQHNDVHLSSKHRAPTLPDETTGKLSLHANPRQWAVLTRARCRLLLDRVKWRKRDHHSTELNLTTRNLTNFEKYLSLPKMWKVSRTLDMGS